MEAKWTKWLTALMVLVTVASVAVIVLSSMVLVTLGRVSRSIDAQHEPIA